MNDLSEFVTLHDSTLTTGTRRIAKHFKKPHKTILRAFDNLEFSPEFWRHNFVPRAYVDGRGKAQREVLMTKDGFMFMVMGFTGKESARIVEAYIRLAALDWPHPRQGSCEGVPGIDDRRACGHPWQL